MQTIVLLILLVAITIFSICKHYQTRRRRMLYRPYEHAYNKSQRRRYRDRR